jgi:hypothetical protein
MKGARFKSAMRSALDFLREGLMWVGVSFGLVMDAEFFADMGNYAARGAVPVARPDNAGPDNAGPDNAGEHPGHLPVTPLSGAESDEWAALVERLQRLR